MYSHDERIEMEKKMKKLFCCTVKIWLKGLNVPIIYDRAQTYQKESLFCIRDLDTESVIKYPISDIFRVEESYYITQSEVIDD